MLGLFRRKKNNDKTPAQPDKKSSKPVSCLVDVDPFLIAFARKITAGEITEEDIEDNK